MDFLVEHQLVAPILIIAFSVLIYLILRIAIRKILSMRIKHIDKRRKKSLSGLIELVLKTFIFIVALMMILDRFGVDTRALLASLGVVSLIIGLSLQDTIRDFIVGFTILFEDQYSEGDEVTINGFMGRVISIGIKTTRIQSPNGDVRIISNRTIAEITNHALKTHKTIIEIIFPAESDVNHIKQLLEQACTKISEEMTLSDPAICLGVESIGKNGIQFRILLSTKFTDRLSCARIFRELLKDFFDIQDIHIEYPVINDG